MRLQAVPNNRSSLSIAFYLLHHGIFPDLHTLGQPSVEKDKREADLIEN